MFKLFFWQWDINEKTVENMKDTNYKFEINKELINLRRQPMLLLAQ